MIWLGLILPVSYVPGYTGAALQTQWAVLSPVLALGLWKNGRTNFTHMLWLAFIAYAVWSLDWTMNIYDSVGGIWFAAIWCLSFWLGSTNIPFKNLWKGLAIGLSVSSVIACIQALGYHPIYTQHGQGDAGLFVNTTYLGASAAIILIGLICHRLWYYIPLVTPALILANSRGAWLVVGVALVCKYLNWRVALIFGLGAGLFFLFQQSESDALRFAYWQATSRNVSWFGFGAGTFNDFWFVYRGGLIHPEFAHNEVLQFLFEYGIGALPLFAILAFALAQTDSLEWPVLVAFASLALFYFPFHCPLAAFIGCAIAGRVIRDRYLLRDYLDYCRSHILSWDTDQKPGSDRDRGMAIPMGSRTQESLA
jgi:hypothetical protein